MSKDITRHDNADFVNAIEFADNPETRCPCLLLLDTSGSMSGEKIAALNAGLRKFEQAIKSDALAAMRVEVAVVTFGPVHLAQEFISAQHFKAPHLRAQHATPMGQGIERAIELITERKRIYREQGVGSYRPWIFMITDGEPTDAMERAAHAIQAGEESKSFAFFAVGVEGADMAFLNELSVRKALGLKGLRFEDLFVWLSSSLTAVSLSSTGAVALSNPAGPDGWAFID